TNYKLARWLVGATAAPTAWDAVFSGGPDGYVLLRLKSGRWVGGRFSKGSHVSGYPEPPDIYFAQELVVDQDRGDFVFDDVTELPTVQGRYGLLLRWDEGEYLEISN